MTSQTNLCKGRTIKKLIGGGVGGVRSTKKIFAQGKIKWKNIHARQLTLKKYSCYGLKKIHTRNLITKKNSCGRKIPHPPPPHNFSNGPFLIMHKYLVGGHECAFQSCSLSTRWGVEFVRHWRNEMRPAIVSGIVTGHVPISYWPFFFSLSLVTVSGVL